MWGYVLPQHAGERFAFAARRSISTGNVNNSVIGDFKKPKVRLPGSAGMGDMATLDKKIYIWSTTHNSRTFVEKVDFLAAPGYLNGGDARRKLA